jgi:class 3 adenylate cyclase
MAGAAILGAHLTGGCVERRLAAVLAADMVGYSRLMGADELGTLEALRAIRREIVDPAIASHKGRLVKTTGDGMLVEFASAGEDGNAGRRQASDFLPDRHQYR